MADIFISYRRSDAWAYAGRICDRLKQRFGDDAVFMDVDTIEPGAPFGQVIERHLRECRVFIALIGPTWCSTSGADGVPRLDDPDDLVRREIALALSMDRCRVIPVQVGNATLPTRGELPEALWALSERNAIDIRDRKFAKDIDELIDAIDKELGGPSRRRDRGRLWIAGAVVLVTAMGGAAYLWRSPDELPRHPPPDSTVGTATDLRRPDVDPNPAPTSDADTPDTNVGGTPWFGPLPPRSAGISSAAYSQFSQETVQDGRTYGLFSYFFVEALSQDASDRNRDGRISWQEAVQAAARPVQTESSNKQSPVSEGPAQDFALFSATMGDGPAKPRGKVFAVLVGISQYRVNSGALRGPTNDVDRLSRLLARKDRVLASDVEVMTLKNEAATQARIWDGIEWLTKAPGAEDVVVFYYSGHMTSEFDGDSASRRRYKVIYPYDMHAVGRILIKMPEIIDALKATKARHIAIIVDA